VCSILTLKLPDIPRGSQPVVIDDSRSLSAAADAPEIEGLLPVDQNATEFTLTFGLTPASPSEMAR
jgi:hypothetical protein